MSGAIRTLSVMTETLIGYARCSTDTQDLTAQRERLRELGVADNRVYLDHGLTGTNRSRPGLDQALAAVREGDTLVVPKLDRSPDRCPPPAPSVTTWPAAGSGCPSVGRSMTRPTRWAKCSSTSWPPSPNSRSTCCGYGPVRAWPLPAPKASCMASSRSCPPGSSASWPGWPPPASTPSPTSPRCSPSPAPPSTAAFSGPTRKPPPAADTRSPTESLFFRWKLRVGHEPARLAAHVTRCGGLGCASRSVR